MSLPRDSRNAATRLPLRRLAGLCAALAAFIAAPATAQTYPSAPIRIVVPFPPGGGTDILSRIIAQKLNEAWGQSVVVDNRAGAGGTIGSAFVAKSPADGFSAQAYFMTNPSLSGRGESLNYDAPKKFTKREFAHL